MDVDVAALIERLGNHARWVIERTVEDCQRRTHFSAEAEHFLVAVLSVPRTDAEAILDRCGVDREELLRDLHVSLETHRRGNGRNPTLSPELIRMLSDAWNYGSLQRAETQIRTGLLLLALFADPNARRRLKDISAECEKVDVLRLRRDFDTLVAGSEEASAESVWDAPPSPRDTPKALSLYTVDLTEQARSGELDPVLARDLEIRQVIDILTRRRQNNPILVGEAGVGKTAVVEGLAQRIASGEVPDKLRDVAVHALDLALLQAGAGVKGEFEKRLKNLLREVSASPHPVVLFIDEAHTMVGAGASPGQGDVANLLKPALARGELRTVAATTWSEYKRHIEGDPALSRRFQVVKVAEPSEEQCLVMLRGVVETLEAHHQVRVLSEGLEAAVRLSARYLPERHLPDKAISVLDTACARVSLGQRARPAILEAAYLRRTDIDQLEGTLRREIAAGEDHTTRMIQLLADRQGVEAEINELESAWAKEIELVREYNQLRAGVEHSVESAEPESRDRFRSLKQQLVELQEGPALVPAHVDADLVSQVLSDWTGVPTGRLVRDEAGAALDLEARLRERVVGQDHALNVVSKRIRTAHAQLEDPAKPRGVFLFVGPSGVGKTETALALADLFFGGEQGLITINMSEFQEPHSVATLKGSPPGYVGYGAGGVLTEAVRRRPYSVVLLDEVEKAHPDVLELFFQVFDKGCLVDSEGKRIDFRNTIIVLTSNVGSDTVMKLCADPATTPTPEALVGAIRGQLLATFKPAFLGRTVVVPYFPIGDAALKRIVRLKLGRIVERADAVRGLRMSYDESVVEAIIARCTEPESGARNVDNILSHTLLPDASRFILEQMLAGESMEEMRVHVGDDGTFRYSAEQHGQALQLSGS